MITTEQLEQSTGVKPQSLTTRSEAITTQRNSTALALTPRSKQLIVRGEGISALDLCHEPATRKTFGDCLQGLAVMYRQDYSDLKWVQFCAMLWDMIAEEGWSTERLAATCKWLVKEKPFALLTAADFFKAPKSELHPYSWVQAEVHQNRMAMRDMESYLVDGLRLYRYKDGSRLPLPGYETYNPKPPEPDYKTAPIDPRVMALLPSNLIP